MSRIKRLSAGNIGVVKPANNGAHSSASRKRAVTIPSEDEASTQSPKRNRSESNDQSDRLGPQSISNDNQTYRTPYAIKYYQGDQQIHTIKLHLWTFYEIKRR